jgi:putative ATPase
VPLHLRNPVTGLMKGFDYGKDYKYAHNYENNVTNMQCLPENLKNRKYYFPTENGFEKKIKLRIEYWKNILNKQAGLKT